mmetsp:Transcript_8712/g.19758  ORF Transcript_8712/g.19758 Transcript_8712/m.19758 type:complete len:141 (-) Transcript_8712:828-1250(-)
MNRLLYTYIFNLKCYSSSSSLTTPLRQRLPPHTLPMPPQGDEALRRLAPHPPAQTRPAHRRPAPGKFLLLNVSFQTSSSRCNRSLSLAPQEAPADRPSSAEDLTTLTRQRTLSNLVSLIISIVEISIMRRVQHILTSHAF